HGVAAALDRPAQGGLEFVDRGRGLRAEHRLGWTAREGDVAHRGPDPRRGHENRAIASHWSLLISCQSQNDAPTAPRASATSRNRHVSAALGVTCLPPSSVML